MSQGGVIRIKTDQSDDNTSVEMAGLSAYDNDSQSGRGQHQIDDYSDRSPQPDE